MSNARRPMPVADVMALHAFGALLAGLVGCAGAAEPAQGQSARQRLEAEIGDPSCRSDSDCHSLPVGSRACGGPAAWLAWSGTVSRAARLSSLAEADRAEQAAEKAAEQARRAAPDGGRISICAVLADPGAHCDRQLGRCVLNTQGGPAARQGSPSQ
jgi:hypothetical protein